MKRLILLTLITIFSCSFVYATQPTDGLIHYWTFNSDGQDLEGSTDWYAVGTPIYNTTDKMCGAASVSGFSSSDYLTTSDIAEVSSLDSNFTISWWGKTNSYDFAGNDRQTYLGADNNGFHYFLSYSSQGFRTQYYDNSNENRVFSGTSGAGLNQDQSCANNVWYFYTVTWDDNAHTTKLYINGSWVGSYLPDGTNSLGIPSSLGNFSLGYLQDSGLYPLKGNIDDLRVYNRTLTDTEIEDIFNSGECEEAGEVEFNITFINCTSCGGDITPPYETEDTTPTFALTTNKEALCAIADENLDYTEMVTTESYRNCSTTGSSSHVCTLHPYDALIINESDYVYIACTYNNDAENDSVALEVSMTSSQVTTQGVDAIQAGIDTSALVLKTVYDNQQVYIVNANNDQILTTFDKFVESGNKRWAFNYLTSAENFISGLFNLTSTFFAAEYKEKTFQEVNDSVRTMIDETS